MCSLWTRFVLVLFSFCCLMRLLLFSTDDYKNQEHKAATFIKVCKRYGAYISGRRRVRDNIFVVHENVIFGITHLVDSISYGRWDIQLLTISTLIS